MGGPELQSIMDSEGDEKSWVYRDLNCAAVRHPELKHWCGYVEVPEGHPLYGLDRDGNLKVPDHVINRKASMGSLGIIDVFLHALNDKKSDDKNVIPLCLAFEVHGGITFVGERSPSGKWWGFDCSHAGDIMPNLGMKIPGSVYRTLDFVVANVEMLADQLIESKDW